MLLTIKIYNILASLSLALKYFSILDIFRHKVLLFYWHIMTRGILTVGVKLPWKRVTIEGYCFQKFKSKLWALNIAFRACNMMQTQSK